MGASLWVAGGQARTINPGNTLRSAPATTTGLTLTGGVTAGAEVKIYDAGTFSLLGMHITDNPGTATVNATFYKNGIATGLSVTSPGGAEGYFLDDVNAVTVVPGDTIYVIHTHGNVFEPTAEGNMLSVLFTPDDSSLCVTQCGTELYAGFAGIAAGATRYVGLHGTHAEGSTSQQERQDCVPIRCTGKNARVYLSANNANGPAVFTLQVDDADTDLSISIAAGQTGFFENSLDEVPIAAHQKVGWKIDLTGAGSGGITFVTAFVQFHSSRGEFFLGLGQQLRTPAGTTTDLSIGGDNYHLDSQAEQQWQATIAGFCRGLCINIRVNSAGSDSTLAWRNGGVTGNNIVTIPAGDTGFFDTAASDPWLVEDLLSLRLTIPGGGQITYTTIDVGLSFEPPGGVIGPYAWIEFQRRVP